MSRSTSTRRIRWARPSIPPSCSRPGSRGRAAAAVKMSTGVLGTFLAGEPTFLTGAIAATDGRFLPTPGGFPFAVDDQVVGGVGVSGGSSEQDAAIAEAAATAA